jgi:two-component system sensor kinase
LVVRLLSRLGYADWFSRSGVAGLANHLRSVNRIELYPPTSELAQTYSEHAVAMTLLPWFSRGIAYAQKSLHLRREFGDVWGQAQSLHFLGVVLYAASRYSECIDNCREAIRLFEQTGDYWEVNMARFQLAASLYRLGDLSAAAEEADRMHRSGLQLGDAQAAGLGLDILAKATRGCVPRETLEAELRRPRGGDAETASLLLQAEGVRQFFAAEYRQAAATFEQAYHVARRAGVCNTYIVPSLPWLAAALRSAAEQVAERDAAETRRLLRRARCAARRGLRLARRFQNDLPHTLRENALLAAAQGQAGRARRLFEEGLRVAEQQGARYEHALTQLAMATAGRQFHWPDAEARFASAEQAVRAMEPD